MAMAAGSLFLEIKCVMPTLPTNPWIDFDSCECERRDAAMDNMQRRLNVKQRRIDYLEAELAKRG